MPHRIRRVLHDVNSFVRHHFSTALTLDPACLTRIGGLLRMNLHPRINVYGSIAAKGVYLMSTSFQTQTDGSEKKDELIVHESEADQADDRSSVGASVRDMAARIPEQLSAIGRDISRTIEKAISAKDDYMLAVKVSQDAQKKLGQL